jgi:hypothetical protein
MAILVKCPVCHKKQSFKHKVCPCGTKLGSEKKKGKVFYHIVYRANGKQIWRSLSSFEGVKANGIEDARAVESKFVVCKRENKLEVFSVTPDATMTFRELSEWYLDLEKVKALKSYDRIVYALDRFNDRLGPMLVKEVKPVDLEN